MISPISQYSQISNNASIKNNNKVSFGGITRIRVFSTESPYTSISEMKSAASKIRNILFNKIDPKTNELKLIFEKIKRNFHLLDKDYYIPQAKVDVTEPYFAIIRTGKNFYYISGKEALSFKDVEKNAGYDSPEWVHLKEFYESLFLKGTEQPTLTVLIDKKRNIKEVRMGKNGIHNFGIDFPEPVKRCTTNKELKPLTPSEFPLPPVVKPEEPPKTLGQMTFDF